MKQIIYNLILTMLLVTGVSLAQDEGTIAYNNGQYSKAYKYWISLHREEKNPSAQYNIGILYFKGSGQYNSIEQALKWFERAAKQDHPGASKMIGQIYEEGRIGNSTNFITAKYWYELASSNGNSFATKKLGDFYKEGKAVIINKNTARSYYEKAQSQGYPDDQIIKLLNSLSEPPSIDPELKSEDLYKNIINQKIDDLGKKIDSVVSQSQSSKISDNENFIKPSELKEILNDILISSTPETFKQEENKDQLLKIIDDINTMQNQVIEIGIIKGDVKDIKDKLALQISYEELTEKNDLELKNLSNDLIRISNEIIKNNKDIENNFNQINLNIRNITESLSENNDKRSWSTYFFYIVSSALILIFLLIMKKKFIKPIDIIKQQSELNNGQLKQNFEDAMKDKYES